MTNLEALLLGLIQGLTEFLPVSSSGHLVLAQAALGWEQHGLALEISVHAATLLAVFLVLRRDVAKFVRGGVDVLRVRWRTEEARLFLMIALGSVPAALAMLLFGSAIEEAFDSPRVAGFGLLATAVILAFTWKRRGGDRSIGFAIALAIGTAQVLALLPGVSRSGTTIVAALVLGVASRSAFSFSFLLSIPAILGATVLELPDAFGPDAPAGLGGLCLLAGAAAFVSGAIALTLLRGVVERGRLIWFAPYCLIVGVVALVLLA
jgi:undecaprenyl-diphosphatase